MNGKKDRKKYKRKQIIIIYNSFDGAASKAVYFGKKVDNFIFICYFLFYETRCNYPKDQLLNVVRKKSNPFSVFCCFKFLKKKVIIDYIIIKKFRFASSFSVTTLHSNH